MPSFPPEVCSPDTLFPCSFPKAESALNALEAAAADPNFVSRYQSGEFDVTGFEPILFNDDLDLYGITEAQTDPHISGSVLFQVLDLLKTSNQDWIRTYWGSISDPSYKYVHDAKLSNGLNTGVFLNTELPNPWDGCDVSDTSLCSRWNMATSFATTFYHMSKTTSVEQWNSAVADYVAGNYSAGVSYAQVFDTNGPVGSTSFGLDAFPAEIVALDTWYNYTVGNDTHYGYAYQFTRFDGQVFKVLGDLTEPQDPAPTNPDACTICTDSETDSNIDDVVDVVDNNSANVTDSDVVDEIQDVVDEDDNIDTVIVIDTNNDTQTTITNETVDTTEVSDEINDIIVNKTNSKWVWVGDDIGVLTSTGTDGVYVVTIVHTGLTSVDDGTCDATSNVACNTDACPYYLALLQIDMLNALELSSQSAITTALQNIKKDVDNGLYDKSTGYKPAILDSSGKIYAQSSPDPLTSALTSQQRMQLVWIGSASQEAQWVTMNIDGEPYECYIVPVDSYVLMLGYRNVEAKSDGNAAEEGSDSSDSNIRMIAIAVGAGVVAMICCISAGRFYCWYNKGSKVKGNDLFEEDQELGGNRRGPENVRVADSNNDVGEDGSHWQGYGNTTDADVKDIELGTGVTSFGEGVTSFSSQSVTTKKIDVHM